MMGLTRTRNYIQYTIALKEALVRLASYCYVQVTDMAEALAIHPVLIYRWRK
jgi:transposase-like protein